MATVSLRIHHAEAGWWWVDSADRRGWAIAAGTRDELMSVLHDDFPEGFTVQWRQEHP